MPDWEMIKNEYITTRSGYRKLAEKYGVDKGQIQRRGTEERWPEQRKVYNATQAEKCGTALMTANTEAEIGEVLMQAAWMGLMIVLQTLQTIDPSDTTALRQCVSTLKDIKEITGVDFGLSRQEREARIKAMELKTGNSDDQECGVVILPAMLECTASTTETH